MITNIKFKAISINKLLVDFVDYLLMFFVVINISCIWLRKGFGFQHLNFFRGMVPAVTLVRVLMEILLNHKKRVSGKMFGHIVLVSIGILFSVIGDVSTFGNAFLQILVPLLCFLILGYTLNQREIIHIIEKYINIIFFISIISALFYFGGSILHIIPSSGYIQFEWDNTKQAVAYYNLYYEPVKQVSDSLLRGIPKNCGIFTEGTMFGYMLNMAYMFSVLLKPNDRKKRIVLILVIMTTLSVMPILCLLVFNGCLFVLKKAKNKQLETIRIVALPILLIIMITIFVEVVASKMTTGSYSVRADHLSGCLQAFVETFPFGIGFGNKNLLFDFFDYEQGLSVGIPYFLALGGLGSFLVLASPIVRYIIRAAKKQQWTSISFAITFVWIFFCTNIVYNSMLQWFVLAVIFMHGEIFAQSNKCGDIIQ